ncbi:MAG: RDD family protein [Armatimonadia bacterium]
MTDNASARPTAIQPEPYPYAELYTRGAARLLDVGIFLFVGHLLLFVINLVTARTSLLPLLLALMTVIPYLATLVYLFAFTAHSGQTPGKLIMGIKVFGPDWKAISTREAFWRSLVDALAMWMRALLIDFLPAFVRTDYRSIHDLVGKTTVRQVRPSPNAFLVVAALLAGYVLVGATAKYLPSGLISGRQDDLSMAPTIREGERWQGSVFALRQRPLRVDDLVAFPWQSPGKPRQLRVARVVGLSGDTLSLQRGIVQRLPASAAATRPDEAFTVPTGHVALLPDNRGEVTVVTVNPATPPPPPFQFVRISQVEGRVMAVSSPVWAIRPLNKIPTFQLLPPPAPWPYKRPAKRAP